MSAEGGLLVRLAEISPLHRILADQFGVADRIDEFGGAVAAEHLFILERRLRRVEAKALRDGFTQLHACSVDPRSRAVSAELTSGSGGDGERGVAEPDHNLFKVDPHH